MTVTLDIAVEDARWTLDTLAPRAVAAALRGVGLDPGMFEVSLLACDDGRIAELNADFRGRGTATNVLSWPSAERGAPLDGARPTAPEGGELGDIAIAFDSCAREAADADIPFADHVTHLLVHATLHLLGFDHERDGDAALMEDLETLILRNLDIPDPYS